MPAFCHPHGKHADKDRNGLELIHGHLAHGLKFLTQTLHSTLDLRLLLLRLEWEDDLHTNEPSDKKEDHRERESGNKPV